MTSHDDEPTTLSVNPIMWELVAARQYSRTSLADATFLFRPFPTCRAAESGLHDATPVLD